MKYNKVLIFGLFILIAIFIAAGVIKSVKVKSQVKNLFKLNKELQEEGYYMADFEFRMLGFSYLLDKGQYLKALNSLSDYHAKLRNREELVKIPKFNTKQEEIDFYLNLQNPHTGAFIDETAPYCIYYEVSMNLINHLAALTDSAKVPLILKYPLNFLDEINTPEKLTLFLNDISYVGWIASKFPQTTFHFARNILGGTVSGNILERYNLYTFSSEWKNAMLKWMYDFQDTATGMWGPKNRKSGRLLKYDLNNTASILKVFRDNDGNNLYKDFPLQYSDKIFSTALKILSEPYPVDEGQLDEIHEWNLSHVKGFNMLFRYLWKDASEQNKLATRQILEDFIKLTFDKYYVKPEGAFSFYPNAGRASPDGFSNIIFDNIGAFSYKKQKALFGDTVDSIRNLGVISNNELKSFLQRNSEGDLKINSIRFYKTKPVITNLTSNVFAVYYPFNTVVLDVMELVPNLEAWADSTSYSLGNWTSMEDIKSELKKFNIKKPEIITEKNLENSFKEFDELYCIGFDVLQLPKFIIKFSN